MGVVTCGEYRVNLQRQRLQFASGGLLLDKRLLAFAACSCSAGYLRSGRELFRCKNVKRGSYWRPGAA